MVLEMSEVTVLTSGVPATTVTVSVTVPISRAKSTRTESFTLRTMPPRLAVLNPCSAASTTYGPIGRNSSR